MGTDLSKAPSLKDAAAQVYAACRREKLALAAVAERNPSGAENWFAQSLLHVVSVYSRRNKATSLVQPSANDPDVCVPQTEIARYLTWARSVQ